MTLYPWRQYGKNTTEEIASQVESQWETPGGAQEKADKAEENAKEYADENFAKNAFSKVASPGRATVESEDKEDTLTLEAGTGIAITTDPAQKKVTIWTQGTSAPGPHGETHNHDGSDPIPDLQDLIDEFAAHQAETAADDVHGLLSGGKIIEESGSNANGEYIRFADGTQICTRIVEMDLSTRDGNWRYSVVGGGVSIEWAASFTQRPSCSFSLQQNPYGGAGTSNNTVFSNMFIGASSNSTAYIAGSQDISYTMQLCVVAIGRWR